MDLSSFNTQDPAAPAALAWGFVEIANLRAVTAAVRCFVEGAGDDVAGLTFSEKRADGESAAIVQVKMYQLPAAKAALTEDLKLAAECEKQWEIPEGWPFVPAMLAPAAAPQGWRHKAAQTYSAGPGIVHAYRARTRALLIRYVLASAAGDVLRHPLFQWFADNVRIVETAWHLAPPVPQPAYADDEITPDDAAGEAVGSVDLASETSDRPLDAIECAQVAKNAQRARDAMGLHPLAAPEHVVRQIRDDVELLRRDFATLKPHVKHNTAVSLGALWGEMLCKETGWEWCGLSRDGGEEFLALVSHDRAYALSPNDFVTGQLLQSYPGADNTVLLLFNMIRAGNLPRARPGSYLMLG